MTVQRFIRPASTHGVVSTPSPHGMRDIRTSEVGGVIWDREPLASFQTWIGGLRPSRLPKARVILRPAAIRDAVTAACDNAGTPDGPERRRLIDDVAALAHIFSDVMDARWMRLRVDVVTGNACRRFHVDRITARLVCTYRGTGTQYGVSETGDEDPQTIHTVATGSPLVMRGTLWPTRPDQGLRHRSPPIEGTGETRLVLVLDPVADPADEAESDIVH
ncbi:hypothetical protein OCH239_07010 [Roseivivax halodurans JCM 10272]|uniref:DUF1826 domain-containing protein n=1 Tax=Roseivivax halodurans JCM 10272 TaxID=1449350 RepID=X7ECT1_9RHOB|nr:DUF1826 domain-containing protein [Roseivivax halodurans]ETX13710.1 hypothetical protein OCH239_07010 [Roseivivax halodurans JCM 10272]